ncbi:MAG: YihA family ribosome biogenesis GTP-binding protein [Clostridia bacterium]|nr:YihA family ribosome biogenesis GTP-binding protein [Clostridia bacterium]
MNLHNAEFVLSAVSPKQYPKENIPEIAFAGRSNVGKSSFINKLLGRKSLARTSSKPGKTAQINFYNIDKTIHLVDLPGYGYASVSKQEKQKWSNMIEEYLNTREQLAFTFLLVDARHKPTANDIDMAKWIRTRHNGLIVFATKADKLSAKQLDENLDMIEEVLDMADDDILIPFSAEKGTGRDDAWGIINDICNIKG